MLSPSSWHFEAIGTQWEIETPHLLDPDVRGRVRRLIDDFDLAWSRFRDDSLVGRLALSGGAAPAPVDAADMLDAYREVSAATGGAVSPLIGLSLASRGYDAAYSLVDHGPRPAPKRWQDMLTWDAAELRLAAPELIDVGALGKGRLVDLVAAEVRGHVAGPVVVDAGGDLAASGGAVRVGLEDPTHAGRVVGVWDVDDAALCASAANRRAWGDGLHHVLDARTGEPVGGIVATWALAPEAMLADAVATALFFDGGPELASRWDVQWVRMNQARQVEWSPRVTAELFL